MTTAFVQKVVEGKTSYEFRLETGSEDWKKKSVDGSYVFLVTAPHICVSYCNSFGRVAYKNRTYGRSAIGVERPLLVPVTGGHS